ncbi:MAG: alpha-ketoglutarate-dependent dioxygenase AlkB [Acidobacteriota bacterium]
MTAEEPQIQRIDDFLTDADRVFAELRDSVEWNTTMAARHTASFGEPYNYSQMTYEARPFHPALVPIAEKLHQTLGIAFNNCLLNYYLTGKSTMGFHSDRTDDLQPGTGVAIVSLGSQRGLTYRSKADPTVRHTYPLAPGSMLYMDSAVQDEWMHAVKKQSDAGPRISLTWRAFQTGR